MQVKVILDGYLLIVSITVSSSGELVLLSALLVFSKPQPLPNKLFTSPFLYTHPDPAASTGNAPAHHSSQYAY